MALSNDSNGHSTRPTPQGFHDDQVLIPRSAMLRVLQGVAAATKTSTADVLPIVDSIMSLRHQHSDKQTSQSNHDTDLVDPSGADESFVVQEWHECLQSSVQAERLQQMSVILVCVAYLRQHSRDTSSAAVSPAVMETIWRMLCGVLTNASLDPPLCSASRSAQGFLSVALCSLITDGNLDELFRFHVWLPDGQRGHGHLGFPAHSHQPFAQSWILAGKGIDLSWEVERVTRISDATHAEWIPSWSDGKSLNATYKTHQTLSVVANTGSLVKARLTRSAVHTRDMTYCVGSSKFHASDIGPDNLHATLFFFDSQRGFDKNASVLGPVEGTTFVQERDPAGVTAAILASTVDNFRSWEIAMERGKDYIARGSLEEAVDQFENALRLCEDSNNFPDSSSYQRLALLELEGIEQQLVAGQRRTGGCEEPLNQRVMDVVASDA